MSFDVALTALLADADRWSDISASLTTASTTAASLAVSPQSFSFAGGDAATAYEELRSFVEDYLTSGAAKASGAAAALTEVHQVYTDTDGNVRDVMQAKWALL